MLKRIEELDGTARSVVRLITGYTDEELEDLGGFDKQDTEHVFSAFMFSETNGYQRDLDDVEYAMLEQQFREWHTRTRVEPLLVLLNKYKMLLDRAQMNGDDVWEGLFCEVVIRVEEMIERVESGAFDD